MRFPPRPTHAMFGVTIAVLCVSLGAFAVSLPSGGNEARAASSAPRCLGVTATKIGTSRGELIQGSARRDVIVAGGGNDIVLSLDGNDVVCAGAGNDRVQGGPGNDRISGGPGNDFLDAEGGTTQTITGGPGTDLCQRASRSVGCERSGLPPGLPTEPPCLVPGCAPSTPPLVRARASARPLGPKASAAVGNQLLGVVTCLFASWSTVESRQYPPAVTATNRTQGVDREYVWWWAQEFEYNVLFGTLEATTAGAWGRALANDYEYTDDFYRWDNGALIGHWLSSHFPGSVTVRYWKNWLYWPQPNGTWEYTFHWGANAQDAQAQGC